MEPFVWSERMSVGHPVMDAQHRQIIDLLNAFNDKFEPQTAFDAIMSMFRYAATHFHDEEELLQSLGYPDLQKQQREHHLFLAKADEFSAQCVGDASLHIRLATFLIKWLKNHIEVEDMKYKPFVAR